jgi:hypothetical protein
MLRRGRPILRTAAIAGTAAAVGGRVQHHQQEKWAEQDQQQYEQQQQQQPVYQEPPPQAQDDLNAELTQLAQLHQQGILTDEEFAAKKKQILGI